MTRLTGELVHWNDARGFGFIAGEDGKRYFVHITAIGRIATRPRLGDSVSFIGRLGAKGQLEARAVVIEGANPLTYSRQSSKTSRELDWQVLLALTLVALLAYLMWQDTSAMWLLLPYGGVGLVSFLAYFADKQAAEAGAWRTAELRLHLLDLAFGVIGGLLSQALFRHKTRKTGFMVATLGIGLLHLALLATLAIGEVKLERLFSQFPF